MIISENEPILTNISDIMYNLTFEREVHTSSKVQKSARRSAQLIRAPRPDRGYFSCKSICLGNVYKKFTQYKSEGSHSINLFANGIKSSRL